MTKLVARFMTSLVSIESALPPAVRKFRVIEEIQVLSSRLVRVIGTF